MTPDDARRAFQKQLADAERIIRERAKLVGDNKDQAVVNACLRVEGLAKRLMRATYTAVSYTKPKTDRLVVNKNPRSIPGAPPAPDNGTLMRSITHDVEVHFGATFGRVGSIIKNPPYPLFLETGTSKMAARPWLAPAVEQSKKHFKADIKASLVEDSAIATVTSAQD
jgi:hypothetical protein